jgi:cholesterol 24(S)-hydroxylase
MEAKIDEYLIFLAAGQETTSNALALTIFELGQNPDVLEKLNDEIRSVLANKPLISADDLAKLEYNSCVFKEGLRKWPPVVGFIRQSQKEMNLNGYFIPKNSIIQVVVNFLF